MAAQGGSEHFAGQRCSVLRAVQEEGRGYTCFTPCPSGLCFFFSFIAVVLQFYNFFKKFVPKK